VFASSLISAPSLELKPANPLFAVIVHPVTGIVPLASIALTPDPLNRLAETVALETPFPAIPLAFVGNLLI
jgi:hypothetical protein